MCVCDWFFELLEILVNRSVRFRKQTIEREPAMADCVTEHVIEAYLYEMQPDLLYVLRVTSSMVRRIMIPMTMTAIIAPEPGEMSKEVTMLFVCEIEWSISILSSTFVRQPSCMLPLIVDSIVGRDCRCIL